MKIFITVCAAIALISHAVPATDAAGAFSPRIIGGNDTAIKSYPFYAAILFRGVPVGGGALIRNNAVITSASCIRGYRPTMLQVQLGSSVIGDGEIVNVLRSCSHPSFTTQGPYVDNDFAVLTLSKYIYTSTTIQLIPLRPANLDVPTGKLATVVGFGTSSFGGPNNKILQALQLPRVRDIDCQKAYPNDAINDSMVCFGYPEGGVDACNDGGSPLVYGGQLVGIDSWSYGCAFPNTPRIFTRVYNEDISNQILKCL